MSVYLFSALSGSLPDEWSIYAEYARRGFFELCGVAAINLFLIAFTYSFAKREPYEYPKAMRVFTGLICIMTVLLVATAVSKMLLYVDAYGLSRLRVYTLWFLILLFIVFVILVIWHIKPYNAGRPIVIVSVCLLIALGLANTDGLIAKYNVWQYKSGKIRTSAVDTDMLADMSDAVLPYLAELRDGSPNFSINLAARDALYRINTRHEFGTGMLPDPKDAFRDWSIQSELTKKYLPEKPGSVDDENSVMIMGEKYSTSLTELDLNWAYLSDEDIVSLQYMTNLTELYLHNGNISDLTSLSSLTGLTSLSLNNCELSDLTPLTNLTNLKNLSLSNNKIKDITPLSALTNLTSLHLQHNMISDLEPLSGLTRLTSLNLSSNGISDLSPLSSLANLTWLQLGYNLIDDIYPLSGLTHLNDLSLSSNQISDITSLQSLSNLTWLDLDQNEISDLAPLSALTHLTYINLEYNDISDWTPSRNIRNIEGRQ